MRKPRKPVENRIKPSDCEVTLQEVGDIYGISRMRVCQIEKWALTKLKAQLSHLSHDHVSPTASGVPHGQPVEASHH